MEREDAVKTHASFATLEPRGMVSLAGGGETILFEVQRKQPGSDEWQTSGMRVAYDTSISELTRSFRASDQRHGTLTVLRVWFAY